MPYSRISCRNQLMLVASLAVMLSLSVGVSQQQEILWVYNHTDEDTFNAGRAYAITVGLDGNVYAGGFSQKPRVSPNKLTVLCLTPSGAPKWLYKRPLLTGQQYSDDQVNALTYATNGTLYAVGQVLSVQGGGRAFCIVCLNSMTGDTLWSRVVDSNGQDRGLAATSDEDGNVYACGEYTGRFYVVSYDDEGDFRWSFDTLASGQARSIVYSGGNVYVAGWWTYATTDAAVVCLRASDGGRQWSHGYNYVFEDTATCIIRGKDGHLYVTGTSNAGFDSTYFAIFVWSLDTLGNTRWPVFRWNNPGPSGMGDGASQIVYGEDDNLYICGYSDTMVNGVRDPDFFVMSVVSDSPDTPRWRFRYGPDHTGAYRNDYAHALVYGLDNNLYVAGRSDSASYVSAYTVMSLDKDNPGPPRFIIKYPGYISSSYTSNACDIDYGADAGVYSCGWTQQYYENCSLTVMKIGTPNGFAIGNTFPSQARHLVKDPFSSSVHAVFQRDNNVYYRMSTDAGTTWGGAQYLGRGTSPSICLAQSPFFAKIPCVVYCDVDTLNRFHYHWQAFSGWEHAILSVPGANPCTPSAVAAGDTVFIGYEMRWEDDDQDVPCIMVKRLHYSTPASQIDTVIAGTDVGMPEMPCLSVDDNFTIHAVWRQNNGTSDDDIAYSYRKADSSWKQAAKVRNLPYSPSMQPFCECYGDSVFVVWCEQDTSAHESLEVWRAARQLPNWWQFRNVSSSSSLSSESPTQANRQFVVWAEQISGSNYDIKYRRYKPDGQVDSGFVAQNTTYSYWPHSQFDFISPTTYLYSLRTEDNDAVYFQNQVFASDEDMLFYSAEAGGQGRSPYCTKRDSFISYEKCPVDIARDELVYDLSFFDPAYIYKIKAVVYHEGIARKAKISLDNWEIAAYSFPESKVETISVWIPPEAYRQDHRATLKVKNLAGDYAVMGPLLVYRYAKRSSSQGGGGVQSSEITDALRKMKVTVAPTVTRRTFAISYDLPASTRVEIELFDVTGRKARSIQGKRQRAGSYRIVLDGAELASGVYFLRFTNQVKTETKKVVVSK